MNTKQCKQCGSTKPLTDFDLGRNANGKPFRRGKCKACRNEWQSLYRAQNPEKVKLSKKRYQIKNLYGISLAEYEGISEAQNHRCAICGNEESAIDSRWLVRKSLAVDHDHTTGKVRGLLCQRCNQAVGLFNDSPELLTRAATYLEK